MILNDRCFETYCVKCCKLYTDLQYKWCKPCQINNLKENFTNWTSGNEKIDTFIQEIQLKIDDCHDIVFEWIPYDKLSDINEINKYDFYTIYSAIWKDGPLLWRYQNKNYGRDCKEKVALKCFHNLQNINDDFLNEV